MHRLRIHVYRARGCSGFTIVEVMVAAMLIGIIFALAIPTFKGARKNADITKIRAVASQYATAVEQFQKDHAGRRPDYHTILTPPGCDYTWQTCDWNDSDAGPTVSGSGGPLNLEGQPYIKSIPETVKSGEVYVAAGIVSADTPSAAWWAARPNTKAYLRYYHQ